MTNKPMEVLEDMNKLIEHIKPINKLPKYRTAKQWKTICSNAYNGNWSHAFENCVEYAFWANDLINHYNNEEFHLLEATDLALLSEGASELRAKKGMM